MDGEVILKELVAQLSNADPAVRLLAYQASLEKLKALNARSLEMLLEKMEESSIWDIIRDIKAEQAELSCAAITFLGGYLRANSSKMSSNIGREVIAAICDVISVTTEKTVCQKLFWCLSVQSFSADIVEDQLDKILSSLENGQCYKQFNSHQIEFEAAAAIARLLEQIPSLMEHSVDRWAHLVYPLVLHEKVVIRNKALDALKLGFSAMSNNTAVAKQLLDDLKPDLVNALMSLMKSGQEMDALLVWSYYVQILGSLLHRGSVINCLLPIVEIGFKNVNPDVKIHAYKAWRSVIDNFALSEEIIRESKRVKLILKVFLSTSVKTESLAMEKFDVWWHFVKCLGSHCVSWFEQVVIPLLQFSLDGKLENPLDVKMSLIGNKAVSPLNSPSSHKGKLGQGTIYEKVFQRGCQALMMILTKSCGIMNDNILANSDIDKLEHDVLGKGPHAAKQYPFLLGCVKKCLLSGVLTEAEISFMWSSAVLFVKNLMETSDVALKQDKQNALEALLLDSLSSIIDCETFSSDQILNFFDEVMSLPAKVLGTSSYHIGDTAVVMKGSPCIYIEGLLFRAKVIERCLSNKRFSSVLEKVLSVGFCDSSGILSFCHSTIETLTKCVSGFLSNLEGITPIETETTPHLSEIESGQGQMSKKIDLNSILSIWSSVASPLQDHILKSNEVNQGNNLEHDFSCMNAVLVFPMRVIDNSISQQMVKSTTKLWTGLYTTFMRLSAMVPSARPNIACEEFCECLLHVLQDKNLQDKILFDVLCHCAVTIATTADVSGAYISTSTFTFNSSGTSTYSPYQIPSNRRNRDLGNLFSLTKLGQLVLDQLCNFIKNELVSQNFLQSTVQLIECLFSKRPPSSIIVSTLKLVAKPLAELFQLLSIQSKQFLPSSVSKMEKLWLTVSNCIQTNYSGMHDSEFLQLLSPLMAATLGHPKRSIKNQTLKMWNATFGSSGKVLIYPADLRAVLSKMKDRTSIVLPGWEWEEMAGSSIADRTMMDNELSQMDSLTPPTVTINLKFSPQKLPNAFSSIKPATPASNKKVPAASRTPSSRKSSKPAFSSIDDDKSDDFVVIAPKVQNMKKILTEHQKEVLRTRSVLPTMYNGLDNSMDVSLNQFQTESQTENTNIFCATTVEEKSRQQETHKVEISSPNTPDKPKEMCPDIISPALHLDTSSPDLCRRVSTCDEICNDTSTSPELICHQDITLSPNNQLSDCVVRLVRLPVHLLRQKSFSDLSSDESFIKDVDFSDDCLPCAELSGNKNSPQQQNSTLREMKPFENVGKLSNVKNSEEFLNSSNVDLKSGGGGGIKGTAYAILVEDSQPPSLALQGQETKELTCITDSETCIMETPEKIIDISDIDMTQTQPLLQPDSRVNDDVTKHSSVSNVEMRNSSFIAGEEIFSVETDDAMETQDYTITAMKLGECSKDSVEPLVSVRNVNLCIKDSESAMEVDDTQEEPCQVNDMSEKHLKQYVVYKENINITSKVGDSSNEDVNLASSVTQLMMTRAQQMSENLQQVQETEHMKEPLETNVELQKTQSERRNSDVLVAEILPEAKDTQTDISPEARHKLVSETKPYDVELESVNKSKISQELSPVKDLLIKDPVRKMPFDPVFSSEIGDDVVETVANTSTSSEDDLPLGVLARRKEDDLPLGVLARIKEDDLPLGVLARIKEDDLPLGVLARRKSLFSDKNEISSEKHENVLTTLNTPETTKIKPSTRRKPRDQQNVPTNVTSLSNGLMLRSRALVRTETLTLRRRGKKKDCLCCEQDGMVKHMECNKQERNEEMNEDECVIGTPRTENENKEHICKRLSPNRCRSDDNVDVLNPNELSYATIAAALNENVQPKENIRLSEGTDIDIEDPDESSVYAAANVGDPVANDANRPVNITLQCDTSVPQNCGSTPFASLKTSDVSSVAESSMKVNFPEIPQTPTSASGRRVMSRGQLILSRSKPLFSMPNSKRLKMPSESCTESPKGVFENGRTNQGIIPPHIFSPTASPSAGILRKKRLREETHSVDSPSPPAKQRRVCFSDKIDTIEIPNRFQQRRRNIPENQSPSLRQVNRQLEMIGSPVNSAASSVLVSRNLNAVLSKDSSIEFTSYVEGKDFDTKKTETVLEDMCVLDSEPTMSNDDPQILMMTPESQLSCTDPVFPDLISCMLPIDQILLKLTTTTWRTGLKQLLHAKNIKTIGNLSSLTEMEVHNLPLVQPKVQNLKEVLRTFAKSIQWPSSVQRVSSVTDKLNKTQMTTVDADVASTENYGFQMFEDKSENPHDNPCVQTAEPIDGTTVCDSDLTTAEENIECNNTNEVDTSEAKKERASTCQEPLTQAITDTGNEQEQEMSEQKLVEESEGIKEENEQQMSENTNIKNRDEQQVSESTYNHAGPNDLQINEHTSTSVGPDDLKMLDDCYNVLFSKQIDRELALQIMQKSLKVVNKCCQILQSDSSGDNN